MRINKKELRKFGIILAILLLFLSLMQFKKHNFTLSIWFISTGSIIFLLAIIAPVVLLPIYVIISTVAKVIGWLNTRIFLSVVFFLIFTPIGLILRLLRKDLLEKKIDKDIDTYWVKVDREIDSKNFEKQY